MSQKSPGTVIEIFRDNLIVNRAFHAELFVKINTYKIDGRRIVVMMQFRNQFFNRIINFSTLRRMLLSHARHGNEIA